MRVLVTGGAGFIGSHLCERLLADGHGVVCLDDFNDFYPPSVKRDNIAGCRESTNFTLVEGSITDVGFLDAVFDDHAPDKVVHLAACAGVRPSIANPRLYSDVNVTGSVNVLEAARKHGVLEVVFGSSSSVYGIADRVPFSEDDPVAGPISPYAASKRAGELFCHTYSHLYEMNVSCLRFFTVYGPRQRPDLAIHTFTKLIEEGNTIDQYGDGGSARDYTYVDDIVEGVMAAIERPYSYEIINMGHGEPAKLSDMISVIEDALGKKARINRLPDQPGDVPITYADIGKAKRLLGYEPKTSIDEGILRFVDWYRKQK